MYRCTTADEMNQFVPNFLRSRHRAARVYCMHCPARDQLQIRRPRHLRTLHIRDGAPRPGIVRSRRSGASCLLDCPACWGESTRRLCSGSNPNRLSLLLRPSAERLTIASMSPSPPRLCLTASRQPSGPRPGRRGLEPILEAKWAPKAGAVSSEIARQGLIRRVEAFVGGRLAVSSLFSARGSPAQGFEPTLPLLIHVAST